MTNGERIKYLREKNRLTQKDIATRLGVEPAAISKYELDMREPNIEAIKKLSTIFNVSIDYLLGRTPDVFVDETDISTLDISGIKDKYNFTKKRMNKVKEIYKNDTTLNTAINELCCGVGKTTFGETITNTNISMLEIANIFNDFVKSNDPKPQIMLKIKDLKNSIIIVEIDSFDDEDLPLDATDRIALYTTKLSQKYNVLGLVMTIDKDENCKIIDAIYQKNKDTYYTQLHEKIIEKRKTMTILEFILNNKDYLEDLITRSTYHSNAIEGSTLTYAETYAILYNDNSFKIEGKEPREIYEAINHKKALELVFKNLQNNEEFDERLIKKLNEIINRDIKDTEGYRAVQVFIQGSEHIPPEPEKVPNLMMYYIYNYNHDEQDIFTKIARYHIEFERIHPFEDGNGRTGRLLINYEFLKNNLPPVVIAKEDRVKYFEFLRNNDSNGLAEWLKDLSTREKERMKKFGFKE